MTILHIPQHMQVPESHAVEQKHSGEVVKSSLVKSHNCNEPVLFGEAASVFSFLCVSARQAASNSREAAAAQKSPRRAIPPKRPVTSSLRDADTGHLYESEVKRR